MNALEAITAGFKFVPDVHKLNEQKLKFKPALSEFQQNFPKIFISYYDVFMDSNADYLDLEHHHSTLVKFEPINDPFPAFTIIL